MMLLIQQAALTSREELPGLSQICHMHFGRIPVRVKAVSVGPGGRAAIARAAAASNLSTS